jgi:hypothetical protein
MTTRTDNTTKAGNSVSVTPIPGLSSVTAPGIFSNLGAGTRTNLPSTVANNLSVSPYITGLDRPNSQNATTTLNSTAPPVMQWNDPQPQYGGQTWYGTEPALVQQGYIAPRNSIVQKFWSGNGTGPGKYGFRFWFNAAEIDHSTQSNMNAAAQPMFNDTSAQLTVQNGSIGWTIMINRQEEAYNRTPIPWGRSVRGLTNFGDLGTTYDIEWLYRTFNGEPQQIFMGGGVGVPTADLGYVLGYPLQLFFNESMNYLILLQQVSISHLQFTAQHVPWLTQIQFSATRMVQYVNAGGDANANLQAQYANPSSNSSSSNPVSTNSNGQVVINGITNPGGLP